MSETNNLALQQAVDDVLGGRCVRQFNSFADFWAEFDASFWYDSQDAGEDTLESYDCVKEIFMRRLKDAGAWTAL